jgi:hypothetical protein
MKKWQSKHHLTCGEDGIRLFGFDVDAASDYRNGARCYLHYATVPESLQSSDD